MTEAEREAFLSALRANPEFAAQVWLIGYAAARNDPLPQEDAASVVTQRDSA